MQRCLLTILSLIVFHPIAMLFGVDRLEQTFAIPPDLHSLSGSLYILLYLHVEPKHSPLPGPQHLPSSLEASFGLRLVEKLRIDGLGTERGANRGNQQSLESIGLAR